MNLMIPESTPQHGPDTIAYATSECVLGQLLVAQSVKGVCAILIGADRYELEADLASRFPKATLVADEDAVHENMAQVIRFAEKPAEGLDIPLDMRGTPFQRRVWEKLRAIPVGKTATYTDIAHWIGSPAAARAVAAACAANPIALAIPCHRVVRGDGDAAGYRWGIERKLEIIRREAMA